MKDDIRPRKSVQVKCSEPGCKWEFWVEALHPQLPDGPFKCGADHEVAASVDTVLDRCRELGFFWASWRGTLTDGEVVFRFGNAEGKDWTAGEFVAVQWASATELATIPDKVLSCPRVSREKAMQGMWTAMGCDPTPKA